MLSERISVPARHDRVDYFASKVSTVTLLDLGTNILCEFTVTGTKKERARFDYRYQNVNDKYDRSLIVRDEKNTVTFHIRFEKRVCC